MDFEKELIKVGGEVVKVLSIDDIINFVPDLIKKENYKTVAISSNEICEKIKSSIANFQFSIFNFQSQQQEQSTDNYNIDLSITGADYLIAETGTVVISSFEERLLSFLSTTHIVVAKESQILPDLESVIKTMGKDKFLSSSHITLITGPSRTADIEKVLVMGVHGPQRLIVMLIKD